MGMTAYAKLVAVPASPSCDRRVVVVAAERDWQLCDAGSRVLTGFGCVMVVLDG